MWVTETGLSLQTAGITQELQASAIPAIYDTIAAMPEHDVDVVVIHTLVQSSGSLAYGLGQLVPDGAGAPLRRHLITMYGKRSCERPKPNAPIEDTMFQSVNCTA